MISYHGLSVKSYRTNIISKNIHTLQINKAGNKHADPIIELSSDDVIEINFDVFHHESGWYAYTIIHCNADWTPSDIPSSAYLQGYRNLYIEDFANSLNTNKAYSNYHLSIPNEDIQLKISGNYAVQVFNENSPGDIIFTACFSVVDAKTDIEASIRKPLDTNMSDTHQEVNFVVRHPDYEIENPATTIKACVYQNRRRDNAVLNVLSEETDSTRIIFQHIPELIFNAGNEYRQMEFLNTREKGIRISNIEFKSPYHYITLMTDHLRSNRPYIFDRDMNGRYIIRNSEIEDPDTEADYNYVDFTLHSDSLPNGHIYINGILFNNAFSERNRMIYNKQTGLYEKRVLLKQGIYNYQYLFVPDESTTGSTHRIEGDYYNTENEYLIMLYYRPQNTQHDQLIGIKKIYSGDKKINVRF